MVALMEAQSILLLVNVFFESVSLELMIVWVFSYLELQPNVEQGVTC